MRAAPSPAAFERNDILVQPDQERDLLMACQQGDMSAYARLVYLYQDIALRTAYLMTNDRQAAEDIAQNAFLNALRSIHRFDVARPFRPWFLTILTNEARMFLRRQRRTVAEALDASLPDDDAPMLARLIEADERARIRAALADLDEPYRTAAVLYYYNDLSVDEVAQVTNCRPGTVKSRLFTARARLRDALALGQPLPSPASNTREEWMALGDAPG